MSDTTEDHREFLVGSRIVGIDEVKANTYNPNVVSDTVYAFLRRSIKKHGFVVPIVVTKDLTIIDGEHRWKAMKEAGAKEIEVKVLDLTDEEAKAETINFNLTRGEFNQEKLARIVHEITRNKSAEDVENMLVMRQKEIDRLVGQHCGESPDVEEQDIPSSDFKEVETSLKRGDVIVLGRHRVMVGDSSSYGDVLTLFNGSHPDLCVTSPPYFNQRDYSQWATYQEFLTFCESVIRCMRDVANPDSFVCCWNMGSAEVAGEFIPADNYFQFKQHGFTWLEWIVWNKQSAQWSIPRSMHIDNGLYIPALRWESICVFLLGARPRFEMRDIKKVKEWQDNVWQMQKVLGNEQRAIGHPAMYPLELPYRCILSYSQKDAVVYEPFSGSGQTLLAAEQTGRICYSMEIDPKYAELTAQRWEEMTGEVRMVILA